MSEAQLEKLRLERESLARELKLVQSAIPREKASEALIAYMANQTDPLNAENEWASASGDDGACCTTS
jgi:hypothetical protein